MKTRKLPTHQSVRAAFGDLFSSRCSRLCRSALFSTLILVVDGFPNSSHAQATPEEQLQQTWGRFFQHTYHPEQDGVFYIESQNSGLPGPSWIEPICFELTPTAQEAKRIPVEWGEFGRGGYAMFRWKAGMTYFLMGSWIEGQQQPMYFASLSPYDGFNHPLVLGNQGIWLEGNDRLFSLDDAERSLIAGLDQPFDGVGWALWKSPADGVFKLRTPFASQQPWKVSRYRIFSGDTMDTLRPRTEWMPYFVDAWNRQLSGYASIYVRKGEELRIAATRTAPFFSFPDPHSFEPMQWVGFRDLDSETLTWNGPWPLELKLAPQVDGKEMEGSSIVLNRLEGPPIEIQGTSRLVIPELNPGWYTLGGTAHAGTSTNEVRRVLIRVPNPHASFASRRLLTGNSPLSWELDTGGLYEQISIVSIDGRPSRQVWHEWTADKSGELEIQLHPPDAPNFTQKLQYLLHEIVNGNPLELPYGSPVVQGRSYALAVLDSELEGVARLTITNSPTIAAIAPAASQYAISESEQPIETAFPTESPTQANSVGAAMASPPVHDAWSKATAIPRGIELLQYQVHNATLEPGEPVSAFTDRGLTQSVWWKWRSNVDSHVFAFGLPDRMGPSAYYGVLEWYEGESLAQLKAKGISDSQMPLASLWARANTTYYLRWSGTSPYDEYRYVGVVSDMQRPMNDAFQDRPSWTSASVQFRGELGGSTLEPEDPLERSTPSPAVFGSCWHEWIAPENGTIQCRIEGAKDSLVAKVFEGKEWKSLNPMTGELQGKIILVNIPVTKDHVYQIGVGQTAVVWHPYDLQIQYAPDAVLPRLEIRAPHPASPCRTLHLFGVAGLRVRIETSLDLVRWETWSQYPDGFESGEASTVYDCSPADQARFFRFRVGSPTVLSR